MLSEKMSDLLKRTDEWLSAHKEELIAEIQGMARIPSVSRADLAEPGAPFGPDCRKMLDYALERGRYYGFETMDHDGYAGSICYGDPENAIGLFGHLDVVPVDEGWIYPPFGATYVPEYDALVGRGVDDNKCGTAASLFVMRMLREFNWPLKHGIRLYCGTSEETGMQDMIYLRDHGMKFPKLSLVPDACFPVNYGQKGGANGELTIACEGNLLSFEAGTAKNIVPGNAVCVVAVDEAVVKEAFAKLEEEVTKYITVEACSEGTKISAEGKSTHTAMPEKGLSATMLLTRALSLSGILQGSCADVIAQLYDLTSDYTGRKEGVSYSDEMSGSLTLVYTMTQLKDGILTIHANSRTPITCDVEKLAADLRKAWTERGFAVVSTSVTKPYYVPVDDPNVVALQEVFQFVTGLEKEPAVISGGNYARVVPGAYSFGPGDLETEIKISDFMPQGHGDCHGKDETLIMEKAITCARVYVLAVARMDEMFD